MPSASGRFNFPVIPAPFPCPTMPHYVLSLSSSASCLDKATMSVSQFFRSACFYLAQFGAGDPHLSLSPRSWRSRPSPRQVMLARKEGSKEALHMNVTVAPFFSIALLGPCMIWVASERSKSERKSLSCSPQTLTLPLRRSNSHVWALSNL